jgi:hypothetical protein
MAENQNIDDQDAGKGAVEGDGRGRTESEQNGNTSLSGQNPHRTGSNLVKSNDSDFPEPGGNPEHSGQKFTQDEKGRLHQNTGVAQRGSTLSHTEPGAMNAGDDKPGVIQPTARAEDESGASSGAGVTTGNSPEREEVNQDPGERQKENQGDKKDDPLAA